MLLTWTQLHRRIRQVQVRCADTQAVLSVVPHPFRSVASLVEVTDAQGFVTHPGRMILPFMHWCSTMQI